MEDRSFYQQEVPHEFDTIFVVESLPRHQLRSGRDLYRRVIEPACRMRHLSSDFFEPNTAETFLKVLDGIQGEVARKSMAPIIHIDAHGHREGLGLPSGEFIEWADLNDHLSRINILSRFNLLVVLAACSGWWMQNILNPGRPAPVWGLIGPPEPVTLHDVATNFPAFYETFLRTASGRDAMEALNGAPLGAEWTYGFRSAANLFRTAMRTYFLATPEQAEGRTAAVVRALSEVYGAIIPNDQIEAFVRDQLKKPADLVNRFATRYFMYDAIPENRARFAVSWDEIAGTGQSQARRTGV
jgi:hypothetical protein